MNPTEFTPIVSLIGGMLIGLSAVLMMWLLGRIAGISGIIKTALFQTEGRAWRVLFLLGLVLGGFVCYQFDLFQFTYREGYPLGLTLAGGYIVGIGTAYGSGCTSGHGVCGMARLSQRSIASTFVYLSVGIVSAIVTAKLFLGGM